MPSGNGGRYRLTPRAFDDLDEIWRFSAETWSAAQADRYVDTLADLFETIATMPTLARERAEFTPPVRIHSKRGFQRPSGSSVTRQRSEFRLGAF